MPFQTDLAIEKMFAESYLPPSPPIPSPPPIPGQKQNQQPRRPEYTLGVGNTYRGKNPNAVFSEADRHGQNPQEIHLYYMKFDAVGGFIWDKFSQNITWPLTENEVDAIFKKLAGDAKTEWDRKVPPPVPTPAAQSLEWDCPCIIGFLMDQSKWEPLVIKNEPNAIHFADGKANSRDYYENKTFGDSRIYTDNSLPSEGKSVIICTNYHLRKDGGAARSKTGGQAPAEEDYKFDLYFRVASDPKVMVWEGKGDERKEVEQKLTFIIDPSGRNKGP